MEKINEFVKDGGEVLYLEEFDREKRKVIHQYVRDNCSSTHISRSEYMSHGAEGKCCDVWYQSSNYGKCWNGGHIFCSICGNITYMDFDDVEDLLDEPIRLSIYKPTGKMMICKKSFAYKKKYIHPFSYRKHY